MIRINLATKKKSSVIAGTQTSFTSGGTGGLSGIFNSLRGAKNSDSGSSSSRASASQGNTAAIRRIILLAGVGFFANYMLGEYMDGELAKYDRAIVKINAEVAKNQQTLARYGNYEETKKQLEADETVLKTKIDVVQKLTTDRQAPSKVLIAVSANTPAELWLKEIALQSDSVKFKGLSSNFNQISDFMKSLGESAYFSDPVLQSSAQEKDEQGTEVVGFEMSAHRR